MNWIKSLFRQLTVQDMAMDELREAQRLLFEAQRAGDWATSTMHYQAKRIERLQNIITTGESK